ncbi:HAD-IIIA family hydrolase [Kribbella monticola]|uniref:HAD-IIIA family hydrolase n=1 Tax=Kribbella monticola TaxID=2185285 RepID=UPI001300AA4B|nr:HAD-IIIA family hydrolase [Kribbella monticola]
MLDRDGVVNQLVMDDQIDRFASPYHPADVALIPGAAEGIESLGRLGVACGIASNQPAAARGRCRFTDLISVHRRVAELLQLRSARIDAFAYCLDAPGHGSACSCRKPEPGLLLALAKLLAPESSVPRYVIGDSDIDLLAGNALGWKTIMVENPHSDDRRLRPSAVWSAAAATTAEAVAWLCRDLTRL